MTDLAERLRAFYDAGLPVAEFVVVLEAADEIERLHKVMLTGLTIKAEDEIERLTVKAAEDKRGIEIYLAEITQQRDEIKQLKEDNTRLCIDLFELSETFKQFREEKGSGYKY
jgi:hypothetical protein